MGHINDKKTDPVLIDIPMPIETPRLTIRPIMPGDSAAVKEAIDETWDDLTKWMAWTNEGSEQDHLETVIRKGYARFILREDIWLVGIDKESGKPVIWTGLHKPDWDNRDFTIGYWVRKSMHGKGIATESTNALLRYAFNALGARRVEIFHAEGNEASRKVIEKLGFKPEGVRTLAHQLPDGSYTDERQYARLDDKGLPPLDVSWGPK